MPDHEALLAAIPAMSLMESRRYLLADGVERWRDRQLEAVAERGRRAAARPHPGPDRPRQSAGRSCSKRSRPRRARSTSSRRRRRGRCRASSSPTPRALGFRLEPAAARLLVDRMGANPVRLRHELERLALWAGEGGEVTRRRPRRDDRRHLRGGRLVALRRPARTRRGRRPADRRAPDRPGRERHRPDLRPRLAPARRLLRRRPARGGGPAQAGRVVAEDAPLRRQAAGRAACATPMSPTCGWRPRRSPTWSSGAAAAPTTATSWPYPRRCRRAAGAEAAV